MDLQTTIETVKADALQQAQEWGWNGAQFGPGKFEGEPFYIAYYWTAMLDGCAAAPFMSGETSAGAPIPVTDLERAAFELPTTTQFVVLWYSDSGFVSLQELTCEEYDRLREHYDNIESDEE